MREVDIKTDLYEYEVIEEMCQNTDQFDNYVAKLIKIGKAIVYVQDDCAYQMTFVLDSFERNICMEYPKEFLESLVLDWTYECNNPTIEALAWGIQSVGDLEVSEYYEGEVEIIKESYYNGYFPIESLGVFSEYAAAKAHIKELESGNCYILHHGEQMAPFYSIIEY